MIKEQVFLGYPIEFKNLCKIYPPKVKEVVGDPNYPLYHKIFTITQEEIEDSFVEAKIDLKNLLTPFEYLLNNAYNNPEMEKLIKKGFSFFTHEDITLVYKTKQIILCSKEELLALDDLSQLRILEEKDYFDFQNQVREVLGEEKKEPPIENEDPRIKRIKAKARYRDRIKAKHGKGLNLGSFLTAICCMGIGITPLNIGELSYAALSAISEMYQQKEKYEVDIQSLLAGADSKKIKPKYWISNI